MDEAIKHLKDAISKDKKQPSLHVELATLYVHKGLLDDAVEECKKALLYDPNILTAHLMLGGIYSSLKNSDCSRTSRELPLPQFSVCRCQGV